MTERVLRPHIDGNAPVEDLNLSELRAHKKLHKEVSPTADTTAAGPETDLSQASISGMQVHRLSVRPERRSKVVMRTASKPAPLGHDVQRAPSTSPPPSRNSRTKGIFTNPHYRYSGGPIGRLITFFANLLKFLEQLVLRSLGVTKMPVRSPAPSLRPGGPEQVQTTGTKQKRPEPRRGPRARQS